MSCRNNKVTLLHHYAILISPLQQFTLHSYNLHNYTFLRKHVGWWGGFLPIIESLPTHVEVEVELGCDNNIITFLLLDL